MKNNYTPAQNETVILNILNDAMVIQRFKNDLASSIKIDTDWCPFQGKLKGLLTAYQILQIENGSVIQDQFEEIFSGYAGSNTDLESATKSIYKEWQQVLKLADASH